MHNINLLIAFVRKRYSVVFLRSLPSEMMHACCLCSYLLPHLLAAQCTHQ